MGVILKVGSTWARHRVRTMSLYILMDRFIVVLLRILISMVMGSYITSLACNLKVLG